MMKRPVAILAMSNVEKAAWSALVAALLAALVPTLSDLARTVWNSDDQAHGPIIGAVSLWLMWRSRDRMLATPYAPATIAGGATLFVSGLFYVLGRSQEIAQFEVAALIGFAISLLLLLRGYAALKVFAFPLFFLIFMVPLPGVLVQAITIPLKSAVSVVAEYLMHGLGYPIGRSGVILYVGQYQLLVADACSGLNSMFTLEALGLLYMNIVGYTSRARNVLLAILIIPISFFANVVRVIILILVTYHFGDEAGQGFIHTFAGMVLFGIGLVSMLAVDALVGRTLKLSKERQQ